MKNIVTIPSDILFQKTKEIDFSSVSFSFLKDTASRMLVLMDQCKGVGLAAPQAGLDISMFVIHPILANAGINGHAVYINPTVSYKDVFSAENEGCLSIPGKTFLVPRYRSIEVTFHDLNGEIHTIEADEWYARVLQHEYDHLKGKLIKGVGKEI